VLVQLTRRAMADIVKQGYVKVKSKNLGVSCVNIFAYKNFEIDVCLGAVRCFSGYINVISVQRHKL